MLLSDYRKELSLTREYVARLLGVSELVMLKIEKGEIPLSEARLKRLSAIYGVTPDNLVETEKCMPGEPPEIRQLKK